MQTTFRMTTQLRAATLRRSATWSSAPRRFPSTTRTIVTKRYTPEHEAIVFDDATGLGIISITDHAQASLGDVVFVELPNLGTELTRGEHLGAVESVKAASDIYAPVSGTVEAVNDALSSEPGLLNKSAEDKGWLCKIKLSDPLEMDKLMTEEAYKASYQS